MNNIKKVSWKKTFLGSMLVLVVTGCASMGSYPEAGTPVHKTFVTQCSQCHSLPHPGRHTPEQWDHVLGMMVKIMNDRNVAYSKDDMRNIRAYLHRNAR